MVNQVVVNWTGLGKNPKQTVLHFSGGTVSVALAAIDNFLTQLMPFVVPAYTAQIAAEYKVLDTATGQLTSVLPISTRPVKQGSAPTTEPVADATMGLIRYTTGGIVNGKRVIGRTFVPGIAAGFLEDGNFDAACVANLSAAGALLAAGSQMVVWARPLKDATTGVLLRPGTTWDISGATGWSEAAVLRRRRG